MVVPLGTGQRIGVVLNHPEHTDLKSTKIKSVLNVLDEEPVLNEELLSLLTWCADYYHHPIGEVINQALPVLLRQGRNPERRREETWMLTDEGLSLAEERPPQLGRRQVEVLELLQHSSSANSRELRDAGLGREVLRRMQERGWIKATKAAQPPGDYATDSPPRMTQEQERCLTSIASDGYHAYLLQGVTGSGKTEVYMQLISQQLKAGRQSLLLVPEIGLTPQLVKRLENRFGPGLAVMHSGLAAGQRSLHFELLALGQQVAADVKNGWIGLRGRGEVLIAFQDGVELLARVFDVAGGITDSGDRTQGEEALFVALQGLNGHFDRVDSHALDSIGVVGRGASKDTAGHQDTQSTGVFHPGTCISSSIWSVM